MRLMSLFDKSPATIELLRVVLLNDCEHSVYELSGLSGVPYATCHAEVEMLDQKGLVTVRNHGRRKLVKTDLSKDEQLFLAKLLGAERNAGTSINDDSVRANLQRFGGPVVLESDKNYGELDLETTVALASKLARRDPAVARALPVVMVKNQSDLKPDRLLTLCRLHKSKRETGVMLRLAGELAGSSKLKSWSRKFRDERVKTTDNFFVGTQSTAMRDLSERNTPKVVRPWKFRMNMSLDTFRSTLDRFSQSGDHTT